MIQLKQIGTIAMTVAMLGTSAVSFAADKWASAELKTATGAALDKFKETVGAEADANITVVNVKKGVQGNSAKIVVSYKEADAVKTAEYFCHVHQHEGEEAEIDCH